MTTSFCNTVSRSVARRRHWGKHRLHRRGKPTEASVGRTRANVAGLPHPPGIRRLPRGASPPVTRKKRAFRVIGKQKKNRTDP